MKILSIGNSFSQDAQKWLHQIAEQNGEDIECVNLFIGGCSLKMHYENLCKNNAHYDLEINGGAPKKKISIDAALKMRNWDVVTLQQVSHLAGLSSTYEPYLSNLASYVKNTVPKAKLYFQQTWAYPDYSSHPYFVNYDNDQMNMYKAVTEKTTAAAEAIGAELIPTGRVIMALQERIPEFNYKNGGISPFRDGFHLSWDYGRYAAAATWFKCLTGKAPEVYQLKDFNTEILQKIADTVDEIV